MIIKRSHIFLTVLLVIIAVAGVFVYTNNTHPNQTPNNTLGEVGSVGTPFGAYYRAEVLSVEGESLAQTVRIKFLTGHQANQEASIENQDPPGSSTEQRLQPGNIVVVGELQGLAVTPGASPYVILDRYRLPALGVFLALFFILALVFGRVRGAASLGGLAFSIFLLIFFIVPKIVAGYDPVVISLVGASLIIIVSIFLAHGFNTRSALATLSTFITLGIATTFSYYAVKVVQLFGLGSEESFFLQAGFGGGLNMQGLLLAGIIIGTLGILDDITTAQTAAVAELRKANSTLGLKQLYNQASIIGREHIASLINTLVLAYAGASLPLFLLLTLSIGQPLWVMLNSEFIAEEVVRTLVGSAALILAVPITTILAAYYFSQGGEE